MSENPAEAYNFISDHNLDLHLAEWSQIQLTSKYDDHSKIHHQGPLPHTSSYATDIHPEYTNPFNVQTRDPKGYVS